MLQLLHLYNYYLSTSDSLIFSFDESGDIQNMKLSRVKSHKYAISNNYNSSYAFNFGGGDLCMLNNRLVGNSNYYENNLNCSGMYLIEEIEAFNVIEQ